jgi:hypothetical protein
LSPIRFVNLRAAEGLTLKERNVMKLSGWRVRHRVLLGSVTSASAVALIVVGVPALALASHPASTTKPSTVGSGYPPPGGIYQPFTNCPLYNPLMHESVDFSACVAGNATSGSIVIGKIVTPVVRLVNVQFGFWTGPDQSYYADVVPPIAGESAQLVTKPDLIPESLSTALGCPSANAVVENLCTQAKYFGGKYEDVYALAESDGAITNFNLLNWTQPVRFQLINPLLGNNCFIGTLGDPVVLNPSLVPTSAKLVTDPHPKLHPDTEVLETQASASDTTFSAPGVSGCGAGGVNDIPVDEAIDASSGLPSASGSNSLTLTGAFDVAVCSAANDSSLTQPQDDAAILLSAFAASSKAGRNVQGSVRVLHGAELRQPLGRLGAG